MWNELDSLNSTDYGYFTRYRGSKPATWPETENYWDYFYAFQGNHGYSTTINVAVRLFEYGL